MRGSSDPKRVGVCMRSGPVHGTEGKTGHEAKNTYLLQIINRKFE